MPLDLRIGSLVLVTPPGSTERVPAQLLAFKQATNRWLALTFDGETVVASARDVQLLRAGPPKNEREP
eukprot:12454-Amphidinium_carterae.1